MRILLSITIGSGETFLKTGDSPLLTVMSAGHALHVFVNGQLSGNIRETMEACLVSVLF